LTKNQNKPFFYATLLMGLLLFPLLGFSQQEEPKRVSIVVTVKEINPEKQVIQLPADNLPKTINRPHATVGLNNTPVKHTRPASVYTPKEKTNVNTPDLVKNKTNELIKKPSPLTSAKPAPSKTKNQGIVKRTEIKNKTSTPSENMTSVKNTQAKEKAIAKTPTTIKNPVKETVKQASPPATVSKPMAAKELKKESMVASKNVQADKDIVKITPEAQQSVSNPSKKEPNMVASNTNKTSTSVADKTSPVKIDNNSTAMIKSSQNNQSNAFSYIWIGAFLVVAGLVLGLLFGKPAFLISFVGVVFIVLGIVI